MTTDTLIEIAVAAAPGLIAAGALVAQVRDLRKQLDGLPTRVAVLEAGLSGLSDKLAEFRSEMRADFDNYRSETREMLTGIGKRLEERLDHLAEKLGDG